MSFILDALRKLEQERRHSDASVTASRPSALGRNRSRPWRAVALMAGVAVVSGLVTAGVLRVLQPTEPDSEMAPAEETPPAELSRASVDVPAPAAVEAQPPAPPPLERAIAPPPPVRDDESVEKTASQSKEPSEPDRTIRLVGHGSSRSLRDASPTPEDKEPSEGVPQLVLQGTSVIDGEPVAVISDRRVFEGDHIDGALVIRIGERMVELEFDGQRFTLSL